MEKEMTAGIKFPFPGSTVTEEIATTVEQGK